MQARAWTRRGLRRATVVAALLVALAAVVVPNAVSAQEHPPDHGDGVLPPGDWSDEQRDYLLDLVERTEEDLPQFADIDDVPKGLPDGWVDFGPAIGGYWHFINWSLFDDDVVLDPNKPEALVYYREWNEETNDYGPFELVSAMYIFPGKWNMQNIPDEYKWLPGLHDHSNLCTYDDTKTFAGFAPCGEGATAFSYLMIHTWLENPPECNHRFGGIDEFGFHCDVHGDPGGPGHPTTTEPHHPTTTRPGNGHPTTTEPGHGHPTTTRPGHGHNPDPPPAKPIHKHPTMTG